MSKKVLMFLVMAVAGLTLSCPVAAEDPYQVAWTAQIGTSGDDHSYSVAVDTSGNAYISGYTTGNLGGTNAGQKDAFLVKFAVPESVTMALLCIGEVALLKKRRR